MALVQGASEVEEAGCLVQTHTAEWWYTMGGAAREG